MWFGWYLKKIMRLTDMTTKYFIRPNPGITGNRYYVMHATRNEFIQVLMSRPDGKEISEPMKVVDGRQPHVIVKKPLPQWMTYPIHSKKLCLACEEYKPRKDFSPGKGALGLVATCRACLRAKAAEKRAAGAA